MKTISFLTYTMYLMLKVLILMLPAPLLTTGSQKCCPCGICSVFTRRPLLPRPRCIENPVVFYLTTRANKNSSITIWPPNYAAVESVYDAKKPLFCLFHGWMGSGNNEFVRVFVLAFLERYDCNVVVVNYEKTAINLNYAQSVADMVMVTPCVVQFLLYLIKEKGTRNKDIHLFGISMGAQMAAMVGKNIKRIGTITGLDPAGPIFDFLSKNERINKYDADCVWTMHTNAFGFGTKHIDSHLALLMNGGVNQPGCLREQDLLNLKPSSLISVPRNVTLCPHARSGAYYLEMLRNPKCNFCGVQATFLKTTISRVTLGHATKYMVNSGNCGCRKCVPINLKSVNCKKKGVYIVSTNHEKPYCVSNTRAYSRLFNFLRRVGRQ